MQIIAIHINTDRHAVLSQFYAQVLSHEPASITEDVSDFQIGDFRLIIMKHEKVSGASQNPERIFFDLMVDNVQSEFERIVALGATVVREPYEFSTDDTTLVIATLADPDGNYFQLISME